MNDASVGPLIDIGAIVHYAAHGSKDGTYPQVCRVAIITEVDVHDHALVGLCVINPTGMFFRSIADGGSRFDDAPDGTGTYAGGTWHLP